jgi:hypothetical protein
MHRVHERGLKNDTGYLFWKVTRMKLTFNALGLLGPFPFLACSSQKNHRWWWECNISWDGEELPRRVWVLFLSLLGKIPSWVMKELPEMSWTSFLSLLEDVLQRIAQWATLFQRFMTQRRVPCSFPQLWCKWDTHSWDFISPRLLSWTLVSQLTMNSRLLLFLAAYL